MHCGTAVAGADAAALEGFGRTDAGPRSGRDGQDRSTHGYSVDCSWALRQGGAVSLGGGLLSSEAAFESADIVGDGALFEHGDLDDDLLFDRAWRWPVQGTTSDGMLINEFVLVEQVNGSSCGSGRGVALMAPGAQGACVTGDSPVYSGAGIACGCGAGGGTVLRGDEVATGRVITLWVQPPTAAAHPDDVVYAACDLSTHGGGWTTVFAATSAGAGDNSAAGLASRAYATSLLPVIHRATSVMMALRRVDGSVVGGSVVSMPMPAQWREAHPASFAGEDLANWPVAEGWSSTPALRTVRYGWSSVDDVGGDLCSAAWATQGGRNSTGLVCVSGGSGPLWYGWATSGEPDWCTWSGAGASQFCTANAAFTLAVGTTED